MPTSFDSGAGNPSLLDGGAGDVGWFGTGAGDPRTSGMLTQNAIIRRAQPWAPDTEEGQIYSRYREELVISQEGGYWLEAFSTVAWPDGTYRIDFVGQDDAVWPLLEPGCYSARAGQGSSIVPVQAGRALRFATPPLGLGVYSLRITRDSVDAFDVPNAFRVAPTPYSVEVVAMRAALPSNIYKATPERE